MGWWFWKKAVWCHTLLVFRRRLAKYCLKCQDHIACFRSNHPIKDIYTWLYPQLYNLFLVSSYDTSLYRLLMCFTVACSLQQLSHSSLRKENCITLSLCLLVFDKCYKSRIRIKWLLLRLWMLAAMTTAIATAKAISLDTPLPVGKTSVNKN